MLPPTLPPHVTEGSTRFPHPAGPAAPGVYSAVRVSEPGAGPGAVFGRSSQLPGPAGPRDHVAMTMTAPPLFRRLAAEAVGTAALAAVVVGSGIRATALSPDPGVRFLANVTASALAWWY